MQILCTTQGCPTAERAVVCGFLGRKLVPSPCSFTSANNPHFYLTIFECLRTPLVEAHQPWAQYWEVHPINIGELCYISCLFFQKNESWAFLQNDFWAIPLYLLRGTGHKGQLRLHSVHLKAKPICTLIISLSFCKTPQVSAFCISLHPNFHTSVPISSHLAWYCSSLQVSLYSYHFFHLFLIVLYRFSLLQALGTSLGPGASRTPEALLYPWGSGKSF